MLKKHSFKKFNQIARNQEGGALIMIMVFALAVGAAAFYVMNMSTVIEKKITWTKNREQALAKVNLITLGQGL